MFDTNSSDLEEYEGDCVIDYIEDFLALLSFIRRENCFVNRFWRAISHHARDSYRRARNELFRRALNSSRRALIVSSNAARMVG